MADNNRWGDRDREWREDRSWNERGRERGYGARGRGQGQGFYGAAGDRDRYTAQGSGGEDRWRHQDRRHEGPAGYNVSGPAQGGWEFGDTEQGGERGQGYERYGYGRGGGGDTRRFDEYGRDPGVGAGYGETYGAGRDYGRGGGYGIRAEGSEYGGYSTGQSGQSRYAYGRGSSEYDPRGRGGEYGDGRREDEGRSWLERAGEKVSAFFGADDEGQHRGRGPKGYRRSDDRIREDVSDRLTDDPWLDASNIEIEVSECEVVLKGAVDSRENKRRAEHLAEAISGVRNVQNHLRVEDNRDQTGSFSSMRTQEGQTAMGEQATNTRGQTTNRDQKSGTGSTRLQAPDATPGLNT